MNSLCTHEGLGMWKNEPKHFPLSVGLVVVVMTTD